MSQPHQVHYVETGIVRVLCRRLVAHAMNSKTWTANGATNAYGRNTTMSEEKDQSMTAHPYPQKIRQAVAETVARQILVMKDWRDLDSQTQHAFLTDADEILAALWEASRVVDVDRIPDGAVYLNDLGGIGFVGAARDTCEVDRMEYILHWGDQV